MARAASVKETAPAADRAGRTRSADAYEELRRDIVRCLWKPGARLRFEELKAHYDLGLSPLRER